MENLLPARMSAEELSAVLNIYEKTAIYLAKTGQLPHKTENNRIYFDFQEVLEHFEKLEEGAA